ncbi:MAG TPA: tannase/feruloyl esterase family alpha/beta hydrolase [Candidatus Solibacter sp.]|nr:tannase/feruloyl esterase family alpha/beta hydrolase [Candidatus Solibacter sp.]
MRNCLLSCCVLFLSAISFAADSPARTCASLKQFSLPNAEITMAAPVAAGTFVPPNLKPDEPISPVYKSAPAFCRVMATLRPSNDSDVKVEVWMPASGWNGKFRGAGNGGFAGYIAYWTLAAAVRQGYAAASTDTGHSTTDATWALGHPEKIVDYGYRAVHQMTVDAKAIVKAFYGAESRQAYFASCSNGGRQGLMEAQRFPADYEGIIAGAPANNWTPMLAAGLKYQQVLDGGGYIQPEKVPAIAKAVNAACDAQDGVKDGVLNDPRQCHFDPSVLLCKEKDSDECLTGPQAESLKKVYAGLRDSSGKLLFPGLLPGAEDGPGGWQVWATGEKEGKSLGAFFVIGYFSNMVYGKKDWDFLGVNVNSAFKMAQEKTGDSLNSNSPDLKAFFARGGKLIVYHGWDDPAISALNTIHYYNRVESAVGRQTTERSMRVYMVPGMQHCEGGPGATAFGQADTAPRGDADHDIFTALVQWVEKGKAPETIVAFKPSGKSADGGEPANGSMTRPLCPYPQSARYKGSGDPNNAASFSCAKN